MHLNGCSFLFQTSAQLDSGLLKQSNDGESYVVLSKTYGATCITTIWSELSKLKSHFGSDLSLSQLDMLKNPHFIEGVFSTQNWLHSRCSPRGKMVVILADGTQILRIRNSKKILTNVKRGSILIEPPDSAFVYIMLTFSVGKQNVANCQFSLFQFLKRV